jgi:hypothetical protein
MDSKKVIEKLIKIAENQQKIITKLAQQAGLPPDSLPTSQVSMSGGQHQAPPSPPSPQDLKPRTLPHQDLQSMVLGANPKLSGAVASIAYAGPGQINVSFKPGQATQPNYDAVLATVQKLENDQKIQPAGHKVHVA